MIRLIARTLSVGGAVGAIAGAALLHARRLAPEPYDPIGTSRFPWLLVFLVGTLVALYGLGLPELPTRRRSAVLNAALAVGASAGLVSVAMLVLGSPLLPRFVVFGGGTLVVLVQLLAWNVASDGDRRSRSRERVAVVAELDGLADLLADLERAPERPAALVRRMVPAEARSTHPDEQPLLEAVERSRATLLVLDVAAQADQRVVAQAAAAHGAGVRIRTLSMFTEEYLGKLPVGELERVSLLFDIGELHRLRYNRLKRVADVAVAVVALVPLAGVVPLVVVGNRIANRGPLLYRQRRVGKGGAEFTILKFRSMQPGRGSTAWTSVDDPRVTPFGRFLRRSHLDELPQALNVLRGDLSLVGPRPEQPHYVEELREKIPFYDVRHLVRPGVTGWAQVKYPYGADEQDALEKLQYEFYYLRHQSLPLDLRIVVRTLRSVLRREGR